MITLRQTKRGMILGLIIGLAVLFTHQSIWALTDTPRNTFQSKPEVVAFQTLDGKLIKIEGNFYVVEDITGKQHRLRLSEHATLLRGPKKPGDAVRVEVIDARAITIQ